MTDDELALLFAAAQIINPLPPEPPVGYAVALYHRPDEVIYRRVGRGKAGWRMPGWHPGIPSVTWRHVALTYVDHLVLVQEGPA